MAFAGSRPTEERASTSLRLGLEQSFGPDIVGLLEGEFVTAVGLTKPAGETAIPDDPGIEINRAQVTIGPPHRQMIAGRQRLALGDERFIGASSFRQNEQTFDAVSASWRAGEWGIAGAYAWRVNRADDFTPDRADLTGHVLTLDVGAETALGWARAYGHHLDLAATVLPPGSKSTTVGASLVGGRSLEATWVAWHIEAARQAFEDMGAASYARLKLSGDGRRLGFSLSLERLGRGDPIAFQTPLGSNHSFQGAADIFLVTPDTGLLDLTGEARIQLGNLGRIRGINGFFRHHHFRSTRGETRLGQEWDAGLAGSLGPFRFAVEIASYEAGAFGIDTRRLWVTAARRF